MRLGGFAPIGTSAIICAGLLLAACNTISSGGLSSHQDGGRADSAGGSSASTGSGGSKGSGGFLGNGGASGSGGGIASGGITASGGVTGKGGLASNGGVLASGGNTASGGRIGSGGVPSSGGNTASGGALVGGGNSGSGGRIGSGGAPGSGGALVGGGNSGSGGRIGSGGASGSGGIQGTGGTTTRDAAQDGNLECGTRTCGAGEYCCSASCGLCVPMGAMCIAIACLPDGGFGIDASACRAVPTADTLSCGGTFPPHAYLCVLDTLPAPCVLRNVGNVTDTYCCP
jgi:hypothetical protein